MKKTFGKLISVMLSLFMLLTSVPLDANALGAWDVACFSYDGTTEYTLNDGVINEFIAQYACDYPSLNDLVGVHPRVFVRAEDLPALRAKITDPLLVGEYNALITHSNLVTTGDIGPSEASNHYSTNVVNCVKAKALLYLLNEDETVGRDAIEFAADYLDTARFAAKNSRSAGEAMYMTALVYDWCYGLLTELEKEDFIWHLEKLARVLEIGYPPANGANMVTHATEAMLFRDLLSAGIAIYDEQPRMYDLSARRLFKEMISAFNFTYESGAVLSGTDYGIYRHGFELIAAKLFDALGKGPVFSAKQANVPYYFLYMRRPDGQLMRDGDNYGQDYSISKYWATPQSVLAYLLSASLYDDPYINEYAFRELNPDLGGMNGTIPLETLLFAEPSVGMSNLNILPLTRFFPEPYGGMVARTGWTNGGKSDNTVIANMKIGGWATGGHDHHDAGSFSIYYKGALAIDSGLYNGVDSLGNTLGAGSPHFKNYYSRSIAHNSLLIYDPDEVVTGYEGKPYANDGGQRYITSPAITNNQMHPMTLDEWKGEGAYSGDYRWKTGEVLAQQFGPDSVTPAFSYIKGDITCAYSDHKVDDVQRSFVFLNGIDRNHPAAMVAFDKVVSTNANFKKTWLLHSMEEPAISDDTVIVSYTDKGYSGKLTNTTLLPQNVTIDKVGGAGNEFLVDGVNYENFKLDPASVCDESGKWRVEVSPGISATEDYFLNVLQPTDTGIEAIAPESIVGTGVVGAKIKNSVVLFSDDGIKINDNITFNVDNDGELMEFIVADLNEGSWTITKDQGEPTETVQVRNVTSEGAVLYYTGQKGSYSLTRSTAALEETPLVPMIEELPLTAAPTVDKVTEGQTQITGTCEEGAEITITRDESVIGTGVVDQLGNFSIELNDGISEGEVLSIIAAAVGKDPSEEAEVIVGMQQTEHAAGENLALNKPVVASTEIASFEAENAVDDSFSTSWKSELGNAEWIYVDLEQSCSINKVILRWSDAETYASKYKIQVSNDTSEWNDVFSTQTGAGYRDIAIFEPVEARYVRIFCEESAVSEKGYELYNIGIYSDLLGYWNFDDETDVVKDSSGNQKNGTMNGGAAWTAEEGCLGTGALKLDGENGSYATIPFILDPSTPHFTASAWARLDQTFGNNQTILGQYGNAALWLFKRTNGGGKLAAFMTGGALQSNTVIEDGVWYHTGLSWDGSILKIYVNGVCENTLTDVTVKDSKGNMVIGTHITPNTAQEEWKGLVDEVRVYNRALSEAEMQSLYNDYKPIETPEPVSLSSLYLNSGTLTPVFNPKTTEYSVTVDYNVDSISLIPEVEPTDAQITVNTVEVANGVSSQDITLDVGDNVITVKVSKQDTEEEKTYTVTVTRLPPQEYTEAFIASKEKIISIEAERANENTDYAYTVEKNSQNWVLVEDTDELTSGNYYMKCMPNNGTTIADVESIGNSPRMSYKVYIPETGQYRVYIKCRGLTSGDDSIFYGMDDEYFYNSLGVKEYVKVLSFDGEKTGQWHWRQQFPNILVQKAGYHVFNIWMKEDGAEIDKIYLISGSVAPSGHGPEESAIEVPSDADLSALSLSAGTLAPVFSADVTKYETSVYNDVSSVTVSPVTNAVHATVTVNGDAVKSEEASLPIDLSVGENTITIEVTSLNGAVKTYKVIVTRFPEKAFIASKEKIITIEAERANENADYAYTAIPKECDYSWVLVEDTEGSASGNYMKCMPNNGTNIADVGSIGNSPRMSYWVYIPQTGQYRVYLRCRGQTADDDSVYYGMNDEHFNKAEGVYVKEQAFSKTGQWHWCMQFPNILVQKAGFHVFNIWMKEDGAEIDKIYLIQGSVGATDLGPAESALEAPNDADLSALSLSAGTLAPVFSADVTEYETSVDNDVSSVTVSPVTNAVNATVTVNGDVVKSGEASLPIDLSVGENTITIAVTALDGTEKTYTVTVIKVIETYNTVSFNSQGGSSVADLEEVESGSKITAPDEPTRDGHTFGGWYKDTDCTEAWDFDSDTVTGDITLYAKWTFIAPGFEEDFETMAIGPFANDNGWGSSVNENASLEIIDIGGDQGKVLKLVDNDNSDATVSADVYRKFDPISGKIHVKSKYYLESKPVGSNACCTTAIRNGDSSAVQAFIGSTGYLGYYNNETLTKVPNETFIPPAGHWVDIDIVMDTSTQKFDISIKADFFKDFEGEVTQGTLDTVNGIYTHEGVTFNNAHNQIDSFRFFLGEGTSVYYLDDVSVTQTYTVSFDSQGGSSVADIEDVEPGTKITAPDAPTRDGYTFGGWYKDTDCTVAWNFDSDTVTGDITLYAKWTADVVTYTVSFNYQNNADVTTINVESGSTVPEPEDPVWVGNTFGGWYKDTDCAVAWDFDSDTVTGNITLYAKWTEGEPVVGFEEDFEAMAIGSFGVGNGWTYTVKASNSSLDIIDIGGDQGKVLKLVSGGTTETFSTDVVRTFDPISGKINVKTKFYLQEKPASSGVACTLAIRDGTLSSAVQVFVKNGVLGYYNAAINTWVPNSTFALPVGQWIDIDIVMDTSTQTFDIRIKADFLKDYEGAVTQGTLDTVNGIYTHEGVAFNNTPRTKIDNVRFILMKNPCTYYLDDVSVNIVNETHTVSFDSQGGSSVADIEDVESGSTVPEPEDPVWVGNTFGGWYKDTACTEVWDFDSDTVTGDITLYAKWTADVVTYTVSLNYQNNADVTTINVESGSTVPEPEDPVWVGNTFGGWYKDADCTEVWDFDSDTVTGNITLYAKWTVIYSELKVYTSGEGNVMLYDGDNGTELPAEYIDQYPMDTTIKLVAVPKEGHTFAYWRAEDANSIISNNLTYQSVLGSGISATAVFTKIPAPEDTEFRVTFRDRSGRILSSKKVPKGTSAMPPSPPAIVGYKFKGWSHPYNNIISEMVIEALYNRLPQTYLVKVTGGTLSTGGTQRIFKFDMPVTVVAGTAPEGKKFSHWTQDGTKISAKSTFTFFTPKRNTTLAAIFVDENIALDNTPFITLSDNVMVDSGSRSIMFTAVKYVPTGYTLIECGAILLKSNEPLTGELTLETPGAIRLKLKNLSKDLFYVRKVNVEPNDIWYVRTHLIYKDNNGNIVIVYSDNTVSETMGEN